MLQIRVLRDDEAGFIIGRAPLLLTIAPLARVQIGSVEFIRPDEVPRLPGRRRGWRGEKNARAKKHARAKAFV